MRHSHAASITVRITRRGNRLRLRVTDDGVGFALADVPASRFGLLGMNERAKLLGGTLRIDSVPGEGTTIELSLPLEPATAA